MLRCNARPKKLWRPNDETAPLRRKAAVWNRAHIATQPELSAMVSFGTPGPRCAGDVFAQCYITALRRRGLRGEGVEGPRRIDQRRACIDCDRNAQRFDQFFFGDTRLERGVGVHRDASVALPRHGEARTSDIRRTNGVGPNAIARCLHIRGQRAAKPRMVYSSDGSERSPSLWTATLTDMPR